MPVFSIPVAWTLPRLARDAGELDGRAPLGLFSRLQDSLHPEVPPPAGDAVSWAARGEARPRAGADPELWLHLTADTRVPLVCQRCLGPIETALVVDRSFRFERDEARAAALDAEVEEDVLVLGPRFDLLELIEDELLLALPLVPRHDHCPTALPLPADEPAEEVEPVRPNPFAALAALKGGGGDGERH